MKLTEFNYDLPKELIAQEPLKERDASRLMVIDREKETVTEGVFRDLEQYIKKGDCLVLNDTRVVPARLYGRRKTGGKVEIFLLDTGCETPRALVRPSKKIKEGEKIELESGEEVTVMEREDVGRRVRFSAPVKDILKNGHVPLPPYIDREDTQADEVRYQTVYAACDGATAAPTAGLHFTEELLDALKDKGVHVTYVTLHTSYGTFAPVSEEEIEDHVMHSEFFSINEKSAKIINETKATGGRIFAVGTTSTRVLESAGSFDGKISPKSGETNLFIYPGYKFKMIDGIITNFHLPESTLLMLISAFAGSELVFKAYKKAIEDEFRFFSYGDAMLIL